MAVTGANTQRIGCELVDSPHDKIEYASRSRSANCLRPLHAYWTR
jgi:hypothetical protein